MNSRARTLLITLGALLGVAALAFGTASVWPSTASTLEPSSVAAGASVPPSAPPVPLTIPEPSPQPLSTKEVAEDAAEEAIVGLVSANNQILQRGDGETAGLEMIAAGFVWGELQAIATERTQQGYQQIGEATVTSTTIRSVDLEGSPPTVLVDVCIDSSDIDVVDQNGKSLKGLLYFSDSPTLNEYGVQFIDGLWKTTTHTIPEDSTCTK